MKVVSYLGLFAFLTCLSGCMSFQVGTDFDSGRQSLFKGDYEAALGHFQSVAQQDPNYMYGGVLRQGIWSYVRRAQYLTGRLPEARQTLVKAFNHHENNEVVNLYLGLTLVRIGEREKGLEDIEAGMKGIAAFINYVTEAFRYRIGAFWDPGFAIRRVVEKSLIIASGENIDWQQLLADGEWIAMNFEREPDRANAQQIQDLQSQRR